MSVMLFQVLIPESLDNVFDCWDEEVCDEDKDERDERDERFEPFKERVCEEFTKLSSNIGDSCKNISSSNELRNL